MFAVSAPLCIRRPLVCVPWYFERLLCFSAQKLSSLWGSTLQCLVAWVTLHYPLPLEPPAVETTFRMAPSPCPTHIGFKPRVPSLLLVPRGFGSNIFLHPLPCQLLSDQKEIKRFQVFDSHPRFRVSSPYDSIPKCVIPPGDRLPEDEHLSQAGPDRLSVLLAQGVLAVPSRRALVPELVLTGQHVLVPVTVSP